MREAANSNHNLFSFKEADAAAEKYGTSSITSNHNMQALSPIFSENIALLPFTTDHNKRGTIHLRLSKIQQTADETIF